MISLTIRYVGFIYIPFLIASAKGLSKLSGISLFLVLILITVFIFIFQLVPYYKNEGKIVTENWRDLVAQLDREAEQNDLVICPRGIIHPYNYYHRLPLLEAICVPDVQSAVIGPGYGSVFVLYRHWKEMIRYKNLPGHILIDRFSCGGIGFYKFKRAND